MKIYMVSAEVEPFAKTGGLGDVLGALPKALTALGADVRVVCPLYKQIASCYRSRMRKVGTINVTLNWRKKQCDVKEYKVDDVTYYFIDSPYYFGGNSIYDIYDLERFAFFCRAALETLTLVDFCPDVIHAHDWSSALVPVYLDYFYAKQGFYSNVKKVFTIHNLQYQGTYNIDQVMDITGLPDYYFTFDKLEYFSVANLLKGGVVFSDLVTTVSPTYAREIQTHEYGCGLSPLLSAVSSKLHGVLNGVDYDLYNPATDSKIFSNYSTRNIKKGKAANKNALQNVFGLPQSPTTPVIGVVSRLVEQKGFDTLLNAMNMLLSRDMQIVLVGTGAYRFEEAFSSIQCANSEKFSAHIDFSDERARQIYAGADFFLMPSIFEPCGLSQIIAMKYGTIPIVRETGGLCDTVQAYNEYSGEGNGFSYKPNRPHDLIYTVDLGLNYYYERREHFDRIQKNALNSNFSWAQSSQRYMQLYKSLM